MKVVKYQLDVNVKRQTLRLPLDYEIMCVKRAYVDGGLCPCLYVLHSNPDTPDTDEVVLLYISEGDEVPEQGVDYIGEYMSGVHALHPHEAQYCFVFIQYCKPSAVVIMC